MLACPDEASDTVMMKGIPVVAWRISFRAASREEQVSAVLRIMMKTGSETVPFPNPSWLKERAKPFSLMMSRAPTNTRLAPTLHLAL